MAKQKGVTNINENVVKSAAEKLTGVEVGEQNLGSYIQNGDFSGLGEMSGIAANALQPLTGSFIGSSFVPKSSAFWTELTMMIARDVIENTIYTNKFDRFFKAQETGEYIREMMFNIEESTDVMTHSNSDLLLDFNSDIKQMVIPINRVRRMGKTYGEKQTREIVASWSTLTGFIASLVESINTDYHVDVELTAYQAIYNTYAVGMMPTERLDNHPSSSKEALSEMAIKFNTIIRKMTALPRSDYSVVNQSSRTTIPLKTRTPRTPVVILFENYNAPTEYFDTFQLQFGRNYPSGNDNLDWQYDIISIFKEDFPTEIKSLSEDFRMDQQQINQLRDELRRDALMQGFRGTPLNPDDEIIGLVLDPEAFAFFSQYLIDNAFFNPAVLKTTQMRHWAHWVHIHLHKQICVITAPPPTPSV